MVFHLFPALVLPNPSMLGDKDLLSNRNPEFGMLTFYPTIT